MLPTRLHIRLVLALGLLFASSLTQAQTQAQDTVIDAIAAVVNDNVVLESDVEAETRFLVNQAQSEGNTLPSGPALRERVLDRLIDQEVRIQHARRGGVSVDANAINRAIEQVANNNNIDVPQLRETLRSQGFDYARFRRNIEQELLLQQLVQRDVAARINVSEQEIDDFVDAIDNDVAEQRRYRIGHILIAIATTASAAERASAQQRAETIIQQLSTGSDFAAVAAAESDGARALDGGDLGYRTLQEVPAFIATAVRSMSLGDVAGPLESPNGLHVITLSDTRSSDPRQREETLARHIFISGDDREAEQRIQEVRARLRAGESFASVASDTSDDPNSAPDGGELPWFGRGELPAEMEATAAAAAVGRVSEPFRTRFGWHVLEVLDRRNRDIDIADIRAGAEDSIRQRRVEQEVERWMLQLRADSFVDIRS